MTSVVDTWPSEEQIWFGGSNGAGIGFPGAVEGSAKNTLLKSENRIGVNSPPGPIPEQKVVVGSGLRSGVLRADTSRTAQKGHRSRGSEIKLQKFSLWG